MGLLVLVLGVFGAVYLQRSEPGITAEVARNQPTAPPKAAPPTYGPAAAKPEGRQPQSFTPAPAPEPPAAESAQAPTTPAVPPPQTAQAPPPASGTLPPQAAQSQAAAAPPLVQPAPSGVPPAPPQTAQATQTAPTRAAPTVPQAAGPPNQASAPSSSEYEAERLARISPSAAPANVAAAAPRYWVEFGAYDRPYYAERLRQRLDGLGIPASVAEAPGRHGRTFIRVRSEVVLDRAAAEAALGRAKTALQIAPLLHRTAAAPNPRGAAVAAAERTTTDQSTRWVQFGAYHSRAGASAVAASLVKNGVQVTVVERKYSGREPLYLVRATGLPDRAAAVKIARQGAAALHANDAVIGGAAPVRASPRRALHPRPPAR